MDEPSPDPVAWRVPPGVLARDRLAALYRRSDGRGLARLAGHGALLAAGIAAASGAAGTAWLGPAMLAYGVVLTALFAPLHECIHRTAFARRRLNDAVAWPCGLVLVLPPFYFRRFYTQDPARDPELIAAKPASRTQYLWQASGLPYWRERLTTTARHALGRVDAAAFLPPAVHRRIVREARILWAVYLGIAAASVAAGSAAALWYWLGPALLGQPFLRLFLIVRFITWNMPYHAEHHLYPAVPFHALPRVHVLVADKLAVTASGYTTVHRRFLRRLALGQPL
jgi:fatty acid desaturase